MSSVGDRCPVCDGLDSGWNVSGPRSPCGACRMDALRAELRAIADAELAATGGSTFMEWPDRWWDAFLRRCAEGHVSSMTLGTEQGDRCLACRGQVCMTFPEDVDGPLIRPEVPHASTG